MSRLAELIDKHYNDLLSEWIRLEQEGVGQKRERVSESQLRTTAQQILTGIREALLSGQGNDVNRAEWTGVRDILTDLSRQRALQGFTPSETASFVFSLKQALFTLLMREHGRDPRVLMDEIWTSTILLDKLGLYTTEVYQRSREEVISRQQMEMMELSTPVVELWHGILALPLIGTLDSSRTQVVMQNLLEAIVAKSATIAIIDITGVPTVDTLVAQHLLKTVAAARLMGAECIISGIRPQIAQTIIHLGVDLGNVITKATLADAFHLSLRKQSMAIVKQ